MKGVILMRIKRFFELMNAKGNWHVLYTAEDGLIRGHEFNTVSGQKSAWQMLLYIIKTRWDESIDSSKL